MRQMYYDMHGAASSERAFSPDPPAHQFGEAPADAQAEPGAAVLSCGGGIDLYEVFKNRIQLVFGIPIPLSATLRWSCSSGEAPLRCTRRMTSP